MHVIGSLRAVPSLQVLVAKQATTQGRGSGRRLSHFGLIGCTNFLQDCQAETWIRHVQAMAMPPRRPKLIKFWKAPAKGFMPRPTERVAEFGRFLRASALSLLREFSTSNCQCVEPVVPGQKLLGVSWPWLRG